jgi:hypothetical protein
MVNFEINSTFISLIYFVIKLETYVHKKSGFINAAFFL